MRDIPGLGLGYPLLVAATWLIGGCVEQHQSPLHEILKRRPAQADERLTALVEGDRDKRAVPTPPPPFSEGIFPCAECHDPEDVNTKVRVLEDEHTTIKLDHGRRDQWCFSCHHPTDRNHLRLASGEAIEFKQSHRLCGQCHGPKLRDWWAGVHGKREGRWDKTKAFRLCVHCHDPHAPRYQPKQPFPAPRLPDVVLSDEAAAAVPEPGWYAQEKKLQEQAAKAIEEFEKKQAQGAP